MDIAKRAVMAVSVLCVPGVIFVFGWAEAFHPMYWMMAIAAIASLATIERILALRRARRERTRAGIAR